VSLIKKYDFVDVLIGRLYNSLELNPVHEDPKGIFYLTMALKSYVNV
jgi:hypothetical protein